MSSYGHAMTSSPALDNLHALVELGLTNPFEPHRMALDRALLGDQFRDFTGERVLVLKGDATALDPNFTLIMERLEDALHGVVDHLGAEAAPPHVAQLVERGVLLLGFRRLSQPLVALMQRARDAPAGALPAPEYETFVAFWRTWMRHPALRGASLGEAHAFALLFQFHRAYHAIFESVVGGAAAAAALRASIWESIFTRDLARYAAFWFDRMQGFSTLITGPSGTGKELVASAIGTSTYVAFDVRPKAFVANPYRGFLAINISAMASTLVESELFGHQKGAFTGAVASREGWLEKAGPHGCVFLDEIGELDAGLQVKLLRLLQNRQFSRLGESQHRSFEGRVLAATNRDLEQEMDAGRFREDLYYRLNANIIQTPPLAAQIAEDPTELLDFLRFIAARLVGPSAVDEAHAVATQAHTYVLRELGVDYAWPGNFRELEQVVRNVVLHGSYVPRARRGGHGWAPQLEDALGHALRDGPVTAQDVLGALCAVAQDHCGSFVGAANALQLDRRTVRARATAWRERHAAKVDTP
jgi:hypothetical protein